MHVVVHTGVPGRFGRAGENGVLLLEPTIAKELEL